MPGRCGVAGFDRGRHEERRQAAGAWAESIAAAQQYAAGSTKASVGLGAKVRVR